MLPRTLLASGLADPKVSIVGYSSAYTAGVVSTLTVNTPAGAQAGDILIAYVTATTSRNAATCPNWALLSGSSTPASGVARLTSLVHWLTAAPAASYVFTLSGTADITAVIVALRGVNNTVLQFAPKPGSVAVSTSHVAPALSPVNSALLLCGYGLDRSTSAGMTLAPAAGMTALAYNYGTSTLTWRATGVHSKRVKFGNTGTITATSSLSVQSAANSIALGSLSLTKSALDPAIIQSATGTTSATLGTAATGGNLLLSIIKTGSYITEVIIPTGWNVVRKSTASGRIFDLLIIAKVAAGGETTMPTISGVTNTCVMEVRSLDLNNLVISGFTTSMASTAPTTSAITGLGSGTRLYLSVIATNAALTTLTQPSGMTLVTPSGLTVAVASLLSTSSTFTPGAWTTNNVSYTGHSLGCSN